MQKICYLLLVVMLVASGKNYGRSSNPTDDPSGSGTLKITVDGVSFKMIKVKGGTFQMGSENREEDEQPIQDEQPIHSVTLSDYYIGETEVTQALWQAVMGSNPSRFIGDNYRNMPVETVRWNDCQEFISKLNQKTGRRFALPTEAQWEFAARGGNKSRGYKYSGSNNIDDVAWYYDNSSEQTHPVGTKMANELGLYDMTGNVCEWCSDWYGDYSSSSQTDPTGSSTGSHRVYRGGSCASGGNGSTTCRFSNSPGYRDNQIGLRLVLLDGQPEEPQIEATVTIQSDKAVLNVNGIIANLIKVDGGTFQMGIENGDSSAKPVHSVTLSGYYIGETEVTQALWQAVMGSNSNPSYFQGDNLPVEQVNWDDCQEFISKLNQKTGRRFALPTEAQWEFAARGGNKSQGYEYSGSNSVGDVAWYRDNSSGQPHPVGTKMANELGLYDMSGNVWEWCSDRYGDYSSSSQTDPVDPSSGVHVLRGGCWHFDEGVSCTSRFSPSYDHDYFYGLRLVLLDGQPEELQIEATVTIQSDKAVLNVNGIIANLVKVEGGTFQMGSENREEDEQPIHSVTLSDYYIGETEVTQALWLAVMGSNPSWLKGDNLPVEGVSWYDCQEFIRRLSQLTGRRFALPTEAQWELAARGGNKSRGYEYSGSNDIDDVAWYVGNSSEQIHPVGTKMANELGLYDMSGNVCEWCSDCSGCSYLYFYDGYSSEEMPGWLFRVRRGGSSWLFSGSYRSTGRSIVLPGSRYYGSGFRLVLLF